MTGDRDNASYAFVALGIGELSVGLLATLLADIFPIFNYLAVIAGTIGVLAMILCILQSRHIRLYDVFSAILLIAYGTGTMNSVVSFILDHEELIRNSVVAQYWYSRTLGFVLAACGSLHVFGRLLSRSTLFHDITLDNSDCIRILVLIVPTFLLYATLLVTGKIGFASNISVDGGAAAVSPVASLSSALVTPAGALAVFAALRTSGRLKATFVVLAAMLLLFQFGAGRRVFWFSAIIYLMMIFMILRPKQLLSVKNVILVLIAIFILQMMSTFYYAMRMASWTLGSQTGARISVLDLVPKAIDIYANDTKGDLKANVHNNYKTRTFVLEYLSIISQNEAERAPLLGEDMWRALIVATPGFFYGNKYIDPLYEPEEGLINPNFGLPVWDAANSVFTAGVADFGLAGLFAYPLLICGAYVGILTFANRRAPPLATLFTSLSLCQVFLSVEVDVVAYLATLRSTFLILGISWLVFGWNGKFGPMARSSIARFSTS